MNNTILPKSQQELLYSLPDTVWYTLRDSHVFTLLIGSTVPAVSLTLTRDLITAVASGRNRKWKRKNIDRLVELLNVGNLQHQVHHGVYPTGDLPNTLHWFLMLCSIYRSQLVKDVEHVEVKVLTKDNSPAYTPYIIGDSIHYDSCLRCGVVNHYKRCGEDAPNQLPPEVYNTAHHERTGWSAGCNFYYTIKDHKAFHDGNMIYLVVGDLCDVNNVGPEARIRVVVTRNSDTDETVYILHNLYGNMKYGQAMVSKLLDMYPGQVYSFSDVCNYLELECKCTNVVTVSGYYEHDSDEAYKVLNVSDNISNVSVDKVGKGRRLVVTYNNVTGSVYLNTEHQPKVRYERYELTLNTIARESLVITSSPDKLMAYCQHYILSKFNVPHRVRYKYEGWAYLAAPGECAVTLRDSLVTWTYRGKTYSISMDYGKCRLTNSLGETYNLKTGQWLRYTSRHNHDTVITKHTIHLINRFLPRRRNALTLRTVSDMSED